MYIDCVHASILRLPLSLEEYLNIYDLYLVCIALIPVQVFIDYEYFHC